MSVLTPIDEALSSLTTTLNTVNDSELIPISDCVGRILAEDLVSPMNIPLLTNSAMDGYAIRTMDLYDTSTILRITQRIAAGEIGKKLGKGEAARIFTGAPIPEGADAVVMQENCELNGKEVKVLQSVSVGENLRQAGEDIRFGITLLVPGRRLMPQDIGLAASIGVASLKVKRNLRVAVMTTGDELVSPGVNLEPGQVYNSNFYSLTALLQQLNCEVVEIGITADDLEATKIALGEVAQKVDCIITTGGVSVGEEDHVKAAVRAIGHLDLWKLAIKPGKPFASGKVMGTQFFGLPGNPVSTFVTYLLLVKPLLLSMLGSQHFQAVRGFPVTANFDTATSGERQEYIRVKLVQGRIGAFSIEPLLNQSSGAGTSLNFADGLAVIPPYTEIAKGDAIEFMPFSVLMG